MKKSKSKIDKTEKISPDKLKTVSGGNDITKGFERMPQYDPKEIRDALNNKRNNRKS